MSHARAQHASELGRRGGHVQTRES
jgi:hypothetical protein